MNGKIIIVVFALIIVGAAAFLVTRTGSEATEEPAPTARPAGPSPAGSPSETANAEPAATAPAADENMTRQRIEMLTAALKFAAERKDGAAAAGNAPGAPSGATGTGLAIDQPAGSNGAPGTARAAGAASGQGYQGPVPTGVAGTPKFQNPQAPTQAEMEQATANMNNTDRDLAMLMGKFMSDPEKMQQMSSYFDRLSADNPAMTKEQILEALRAAPFNQ